MTRSPTGPRPARSVRRASAGWAVLAVLLALATGWGDAAWWAPLVLLVAVAGAELGVVHLPFARHRWTFSLTGSVLVCGLVAASGAWVVLGAAAGAAVAGRVRQQPRLQLQHTVGSVALASGGAAAVCRLAGGGLAGGLAGLAAWWALSHALTAFAVSLTSRQRLRSLLVSTAPRSALQAAGNCSLGLLAAHLAVDAPLGLFGLVVPLGLLFASYRSQGHRAAEVRLFSELARGQEQSPSRSTDASAQVVLTAAARLLGGADVEMVLLAAEGPVRYAGDETGVPQRLRVDPDAFDEPWVLRALASPGVCSGTQDGRPWCSAVLGPHDAPLAVLLARRGLGSAPFGRQETRLAHVLVRQAEAWLSVADLSARQSTAARALGDLGAETAPALALLRDSAERLTHLAVGEGGVDSVVEELHLVERAVASLLGAVALAAEPDLLSPTRVPLPGRTPARAATDWTSTGVFE